MFEKSLRRRPWKQLRGRVVDPIPVYPNTVPYSQSPTGKAVVEAKKAARKSGLMDSVFDTFVSRSGSHSSHGALSVIPKYVSLKRTWHAILVYPFLVMLALGLACFSKQSPNRLKQKSFSMGLKIVYGTKKPDGCYILEGTIFRISRFISMVTFCWQSCQFLEPPSFLQFTLPSLRVEEGKDATPEPSINPSPFSTKQLELFGQVREHESAIRCSAKPYTVVAKNPDQNTSSHNLTISPFFAAGTLQRRLAMHYPIDILRKL